MGATDLQADADTTSGGGATQQDIYYMKGEGKLIVQDLEQTELDRAKERELKRKRQDAFGYGSGEDISDESDVEGANSGLTKKVVRQGAGSKAGGVQQPYKRDLGKL